MSDGLVRVEVERTIPGAALQVVHRRFREPPRELLRGTEGYRLEFSLGPRHRAARATFPSRWKPGRFERLGDLFLVSPSMELLACSDETAPLLSLVCNLEKEAIVGLLDTIPAMTDRHLSASLDIRDMPIRACLERMAREMREPDFASEMVLELAVRGVAIELVRRGRNLLPGRASGGLAGWQLRAIEERVREDGAAPTLAELAALCRVSVRQLTRGFQASRGSSVGSYVIESQMRQAKRLLMDGGEAISTIASSLGFSNSSNFCSAFKRRVGVTPGQYRRSLGAS